MAKVTEGDTCFPSHYFPIVCREDNLAVFLMSEVCNTLNLKPETCS